MELNEPIREILALKGREVWAISPEASVFDAIAMMSDKYVGALMVLADGKLAGVISERDYARKVILQGKSSRDTKVSEIMTTPVVSVTPNETVDQCMRLMTHHRIRHLPVVENGRVVGVISIGDLVRRTISAQEATIHHLENYIVGKYPA